MNVLMLAVVSVVAGVGIAGCRSTPQHFGGDGATALVRLAGRAGPVRFAQVNERIFRGGQPSALHLEELRAAGVTTVFSLRAEDRLTRQAEEREARRLGLRFVYFPFSGVLGADDAFLTKIVDALRDPAQGRIYVHCKLGRDRTSLVVALYRVAVDRWAPELAWQREALDFGHRPRLFFRKFGEMYRRMVSRYQRAATEAAERSPARAPSDAGPGDTANRPSELIPKLSSSSSGSAATLGAARVSSP